MSGEKRTIIGLGELLWDLLPDGRRLGGAPANFAYWITQLGDDGSVVSRVGEDDLGREAVAQLQSAGLTTSYIQNDPQHPTGTVPVVMSSDGEPTFTITEDVAWDYLEWTPRLEKLAARADAVCFGTLGQRSPRSRDTIHRFLRATRPDAVRVYDVNLRRPFFSDDVLAASLQMASVLKLNDGELAKVASLFGLGGGTEAAMARRLCDANDLDLVCVTRGAKGSLLVTHDEVAEHPGISVTVADTIGAGDSFTAALTHHYLRGASLQLIGEAAGRLGAWVASQVGGMTAPDPAVLEEITR